MVIAGSIGCADVPELSLRVRALAGRGPVVCDLRGLVDADAETVDALARLQLAAIRLGGRILLRDPPGELRELLDLMGLDGVLPTAGTQTAA